jgi:hypothetical protein
MNAFRRLALIVVVTAATVWFGVTFGPVHNVRADIYMKLASAYSGNPDAAGKQGAEREGVTLMNASKLHYRVYQSSVSVHDVLDSFQQSMAPKEFHVYSPKRLPAFAGLEKAAPQLPFLESLLSRSRFVRDESKDWGYASFLDLGPEANLDWHAEFKKKTLAYSKSGRLGDLGTARTIVAAANPVSKSTTVMSYWTDPEFNLKNFEDHGGDMPGSDVEGLPRIEPLRRVLTFDHVEDRLGFLLVMYQTTLAPEAAIDAFESRARAAGWGGHASRDQKGRSDAILFLSREGVEVQIVAAPEKDGSAVLISRRRSR